MSGAPRNRRAFAIGQQRREFIRQLMLERAQRFPLAKPLTGEQIRERLRRRGQYLAISTVHWHVERIRLEADQAAAETEDAERCNRSNSSPDGQAA
ncbi:MAG TPA: hypothetical protein VFA39_04330 [Steroidobacteraceae bacterium]|nr:hypothetical protein [Steroidobacteraceae bacterium]